MCKSFSDAHERRIATFSEVATAEWGSPLPVSAELLLGAFGALHHRCFAPPVLRTTFSEVITDEGGSPLTVSAELLLGAFGAPHHRCFAPPVLRTTFFELVSALRSKRYIRRKSRATDIA